MVAKVILFFSFSIKIVYGESEWFIYNLIIERKKMCVCVYLYIRLIISDHFHNGLSDDNLENFANAK